MFLVHADYRVSAHPAPPGADDPATSDATAAFATRRGLQDLIGSQPSEWGVKLWNALPGTRLILTGKFRNRQTAVERIWQKLCELYPDAVPSEDMPKVKERKRHAKAAAKTGNSGTVSKTRTKRRAQRNQATANGTRKSAWAEELTEALRKRFNPGDSFGLPDVYKLIPQFQRRHKENHHIAARLRTTLAQDLRGKGIVKTTGKGKYRLVA